MKYPEDFESLKGTKLVNADLNSSLVIDTLIETSQDVEIKAKIWQ